MKHATPAALRALAPLLAEIRCEEMHGVIEKHPGTFYRKGRGLLIFMRIRSVSSPI
jgi:hypothetical protein